MRNKQEVIKIWGVILALSLGTFVAMWLYNTPETLLFMRMLNIIFFMYLFYRAKKTIDGFKDAIKSGWAEHLFDPKYLYIMLSLLIAGMTAGAISEYVNIPPFWFWGYMAGVIIIPLSSGVIPITFKDNKWRRK